MKPARGPTPVTTRAGPRPGAAFAPHACTCTQTRPPVPGTRDTPAGMAAPRLPQVKGKRTHDLLLQALHVHRRRYCGRWGQPRIHSTEREEVSKIPNLLMLVIPEHLREST